MRRLASIVSVVIVGMLLNAVTLNSSFGQRIYGDTLPDNLSEDERVKIFKSVQDKVSDLQFYLTEIANKSRELGERMEMIESALKLFSSENNIVQVSSVRTGQVVQLPVRQYFRKLAAIKVTKVEITFYKGVIIQNIRRGSDGWFYGTALMFQETKLYHGSENKTIYKDRTVKKVNFKSKQEIHRLGDEKNTVVETYIEDINVKETSA